VDLLTGRCWPPRQDGDPGGEAWADYIPAVRAAVPRQAPSGQHGSPGQQDSWADVPQQALAGQHAPSGQHDAFRALVWAAVQHGPSGQQPPSGQQEGAFAEAGASVQQGPSGQQSPAGQHEAFAWATVSPAWTGVPDRARARAVPDTASTTTRAVQA
jgi:hypothetical protein